LKIHVSKWSSLTFGLVLFFTPLSLSGCGEGFQSAISPGRAGSSSGGIFDTTPVGSAHSNLLDNSSFEAGLNGWEDWGNSVLLASGTHSGAASLRVIGGSGGRGQEVIYRLKTGATYLLKAYARVTDLSDQVYLGVRFFDTGNATIGDERVRVNTQSYSEYSVRFTLPQEVSSAKIYMYKQNSTSTPADFDDFSLTMVEGPVNPPMEPAVANPGGAQPSGPAPGGGWTLVFNDDFSASNLNTSVWNTGYWFSYNIDNQLQAFRPENVRLNGGTLSLVAESRATTTTWGDPANYASGAVTTRNKFTFTFGVAEARLRVPKGRGLEAGLWLLPNNKRSPPEIDVMHVRGAAPTTAELSYLWMDASGTGHAQPMSASPADFSAAYHTFTVEWLPDHIAYYIDGVLQGRYSGDYVLRDPAFLILDLAVGGDSAGSPDGTTVFPQSFDVDYVRVWQKP
jgi:hypothetical protein